MEALETKLDEVAQELKELKQTYQENVTTEESMEDELSTVNLNIARKAREIAEFKEIYHEIHNTCSRVYF